MSSPYLNCSYAGRRRKRAAIGILFYKFVLYGSRRKGEESGACLQKCPWYGSESLIVIEQGELTVRRSL